MNKQIYLKLFQNASEADYETIQALLDLFSPERFQEIISTTDPMKLTFHDVFENLYRYDFPTTKHFERLSTLYPPEKFSNEWASILKTTFRQFQEEPEKDRLEQLKDTFVASSKHISPEDLSNHFKENDMPLLLSLGLVFKQYDFLSKHKEFIQKNLYTKIKMKRDGYHDVPADVLGLFDEKIPNIFLSVTTKEDLVFLTQLGCVFDASKNPISFSSAKGSKENLLMLQYAKEITKTGDLSPEEMVSYIHSHWEKELDTKLLTSNIKKLNDTQPNWAQQTNTKGELNIYPFLRNLCLFYPKIVSNDNYLSNDKTVDKADEHGITLSQYFMGGEILSDRLSALGDIEKNKIKNLASIKSLNDFFFNGMASIGAHLSSSNQKLERNKDPFSLSDIVYKIKKFEPVYQQFTPEHKKFIGLALNTLLRENHLCYLTESKHANLVHLLQVVAKDQPKQIKTKLLGKVAEAKVHNFYVNARGDATFSAASSEAKYQQTKFTNEEMSLIPVKLVNELLHRGLLSLETRQEIISAIEKSKIILKTGLDSQQVSKPTRKVL